MILQAAEPLPPAGRLLASQCFQCHSNTAGRSGGFESITGKNAAEIIKEMREMKAKAKPGDIMERHAKGYTDEQIRQIAAYLATLPSQEDHGDSDEDGDDD
jgi:cytochrome c553